MEEKNQELTGTDSRTLPEDLSPRKKRIWPKLLVFVFVCILIAGLAALLLNVVPKIYAGFTQAVSWENAPVVQILWAVIRQIVSLLVPVLLPAIAIVLIWFALFAAKKLYYERKRFGKQSFGQVCFVILDSAQEFLARFIKHAPVIALIFASLVGLNTVFVSVSNLRKVVDNMQRIKELGIMVKNLSRVEDVARITMLGQTLRTGPADMEKRYKIEVLSEDGETVSSQELVLKGREIAIDSINVNFEYSEIEAGKNQNIAYPYRVYSEYMRPDEGIPLTCMFNEENLPVIYCLESDEIYGLTEDVYFKRLKELFSILKDVNLSREMGIRSANGVVNHFSMKAGEVCTISVEATGGLSVHRKTNLDAEEDSE